MSMRTHVHRLRSSYLGTQRELISFHYGTGKPGQKIYIQSSLHADELPGMLVSHALRKRLAAIETANHIHGEIVIVPVANPIGLAQTAWRSQIGRFDLATGENFNRHYHALFADVVDRLKGALTPDADQNRELIRAAMRAALNNITPSSELESMRHTLLQLACDADVVLDLHCDSEAVLHLYTGTPLWPQCEPLARYMGAYATLLATESGDNPFDEICSQTWWQLEAHYKDQYPIPMACLSVTVELRGQADVSYQQAEQDATNILAFLTHRGVIDASAGAGLPLPALKYPATPLAGSASLDAPCSGVVVFHKKPGDWVKNGEAIVDIVDPLSGAVTTLTTPTDGVLYARENRYFATVGMRLAKVAGPTAFRTGKLLSA